MIYTFNIKIIHMKRGFSIVALFIIILVLTGIGFGGYYAYNKYIAPALNPNSAFIPEGLKDYAKGSDAELFVIFNDKNENVKNLLKTTGIPDEYNLGLKSGLLLAKNSTQCAAAALEFDSSEKAANAKILIENSNQKNTIPGVTPQIEQKDRIITIDINEGFSCFSGNLTDNPVFKTLDSNYADNQLIMAIDNKKIPDLASVFSGPLNTINNSTPNLSSFIPVANAQLIRAEDTPTNIAGAQPYSAVTNPESAMLLYALENTVIYAKAENLNISLTLQMKLMDKSTLEASEMFKLIPNADANKFYEEADKTFNINLNEQFKKVKDQMPSFEGTSKYKDLTITFTVKFDIKEVLTMMFAGIGNAESRGRDAARIGNLNSFVAAVEAYNSDNGKYPDKSGCFNTLGMIDYFYNGQTPKAPSGSQTFDDVVCEDGYYYQFLGKDNYVLWAKMEEKNNNNIDLTPTEVEKLIGEGKMPKTTDKCTTTDCGTYYIVNKINMLVPADSTETSSAKVKRKTTTTTEDI